MAPTIVNNMVLPHRRRHSSTQRTPDHIRDPRFALFTTLHRLESEVYAEHDALQEEVALIEWSRRDRSRRA